MSMLDTTKTSIAFKKLIGKAETDVLKEGSNEALSSGVTVAGSTVFGTAIPGTPSSAALYTLTGNKVEFVRLVLTADPSSNGHAFIASLPADYQTNSSNTKKGSGSFLNGATLASSAGSLQIVPPLFGANYEAKPYRGGSATKGSGSLVAPGDPVDWNLDYFNGVLFQENNPDTSPAAMTYLECFIWVGSFVSDLVSDISSSVSDLIVKANHTVISSGSFEVVDTLDLTKFSTAKWIITATKSPYLFSTEITASAFEGSSVYTPFGEVKLGDPDPLFCEYDVDISGNSMRLLAKSNTTNVNMNVVRINISQA